MESVERVGSEEKEAHQMWTLCLHASSDLSRVSPAVFVYLLKECYAHGTCKATMKFQVLQQQVHKMLHNDPYPGPATFVVQCLYVIPLLGPPYTEGFSHLVVSALRRLQIGQSIPIDLSEAKNLAAQLFINVVAGLIIHEDRIIVKLLENFDVRLEDIARVICGGSELSGGSLDTARACIEQYICGLIKSKSYMTAVNLSERFSICQSSQCFLDLMLEGNQFKAAEKWAAFMGKPMLSILVQKYIDMKMLKNAYEIIKNNNLQQEFPHVYHMYKESTLKKLAEKGCWDIAETRTNKDIQLVQYLVYLAMEAGYSEKVDELCERYSLQSPMKKDLETISVQTHYLHLNELTLEDVIWVDEIDGLLNATSHIEECKVVGIDCEWKPNYEKGSKPNKVSIMQIASEKMVFIIDLIKLFKDDAKILDHCLKCILHSPNILKLGYNFQCDIKQLAHSYEELECFKHYEMLLDLQNVFKEPCGGLSGLAKKTLGAGLNKTRRNSNWEQRPLTQNQLEYAALDAAVLIHIFHHVLGQSQPTSVKEGQVKNEWKSYIVSHMDNTKKAKNTYTYKKRKEFRRKDTPSQSK
ncbi:PREDICTED: uncharacterized protein LOC104598841 [Nelumbo nucifera]|uniref:Uncharacterized protein LOC104598841 n=2 Tax=Nelumbo nucifera TaxID=4432 RepID=A0A1U7ZZS3_NELNU|nr:PREDICTED: uncharacterized protein LOC104598841 [Nelumbo nucifera]XP_010259383.1 PREDICTED: uncharacterized protein LOC104598841 [Nelumbo nucifera]XP_010259384.1 PREDICTED: uncharacterized protein LOC104598841 [Nelumbo nucifera]DAD38198.1 TPA_asm: hypothetical protein HUJ06_008839 [Nelumbo nucifera]